MGRCFTPLTKWAPDHCGSPAGSMLLTRSNTLVSNVRSSRRADLRAEAVVHPEAEGQELVRVGTGDVEGHRVLEDVLVAVGRRVAGEHDLALADELATELDVLLRPPEEAAHRARPAEHLLRRVPHERGVVVQRLQLVGVAEQCFEAAGQAERRGVVPGGGDDDVVPEPLEIAERGVVDAPVGDDGGEVAGGVRLPVGGEGVEVLLELADVVRDEIEGVAEVTEELRIGRAEQALGELEHEALVLGRHAEDPHDHVQRERNRQVGREVARAAELEETVGVLVGDPVDGGLEVLHGGRLEPVVGDGAVLLVHLAVEVDERAGRLDAHRLEHVVLHVGTRRRARRVPEHVAAARDLEDVSVLGDRPERRPTLGLDAQDGRLAA